MTIKESLNQDMKDALRAGRKVELGALRMAIAAIKTQEIEVRGALDDDAVVKLLGRLVKQGREAHEHFEAAGRTAQAEKEAAEIEVLERYLPTKLDAAATEALIRRAIEATEAAGPGDMGRVMAFIKTEGAGQVDMAAASKRTREILASG